MVYILKNMNLFDMSPFKEKNDAFKRLLDVANLNAMTPHERAVYDENLKIYRDWRASIFATRTFRTWLGGILIW